MRDWTNSDATEASDQYITRLAGKGWRRLQANLTVFPIDLLLAQYFWEVLTIAEQSTKSANAFVPKGLYVCNRDGYATGKGICRRVRCSPWATHHQTSRIT
jgi:hypothetical protein